MLKLHTDWAYLERQFECALADRFLMAVRSLDNPRAVTPFLVERGDERFGLFLHVEKGNVAAARLPADITPVFYRPYFTFEPAERAHATLDDAVESIAAGESAVTLDAAAPLAIATELAARFKVAIEAAPTFGSVSLRAVPRNLITERLRRDRPRGVAAATRLLARSPVRTELTRYLGAVPDAHFASLDRALADFAGVIVSSALNMQQVAGVPAGTKHRPFAAVYVPGADQAWIMESGTQYPSPRAALEAIVGQSGMLGVEADDLPAGLAHALGLDDRPWQSADRALRRWRDENTLADLPWYIIASRTTHAAIEAAFSHARDALARGRHATEMDSYAPYLETMRAFATQALPNLRAVRTLTNFHSGARTIFPSNAAPYPLDHTINTLKLDVGCWLYDREGWLLGCSDIARTFTLSPDAEALYRRFEQGVRHHLIPAARVGASGADMHRAGVAAVWNASRDLAGNPLFVELADPQREYDRDCGHLLGKNNLAHLRFVHDESQVLREGMIACCEYQWPMRNHAIAYEDTCLVTPSGGLNITSDAQ